MDGLVVRPSPGRGRGVFAIKDFAKGDLVERAPALVLPGEQRKLIAATVLGEYFFNWTDSAVVALPLGYGCIYNHSRQPNCAFHQRIKENCIDFVALEDIHAGDEIFTNYGKHPYDQTPRWFEKEPASVSQG